MYSINPWVPLIYDFGGHKDSVHSLLERGNSTIRQQKGENLIRAKLKERAAGMLVILLHSFHVA